jgi:hypothetical protein
LREPYLGVAAVERRKRRRPAKTMAVAQEVCGVDGGGCDRPEEGSVDGGSGDRLLFIGLKISAAVLNQNHR